MLPLAAFHTPEQPAVENLIPFFHFLPLVHKQQVVFDQHLMLRKEGNTRNKRTARIHARRTDRHVPATWTGAKCGTAFFLTIFSNSNMTFVLQNGITCCKYSVSWGPSVFLVEHETALTWISVLHWQEEKKEERNRTKRKTLQGKLVIKEMWSFLTG